MLREAKRPVIYSGGGVILGDAADEFTQLTKMLNFPITNTLMGLGAFPGTDRQFLGMLGMHGSYAANMAMHYSDLILAIGVRFDDRVTNGVAKFCPSAQVIHIDIDPASISKNIAADVPIVGPVKPILTDMLAFLEEKPISESRQTALAHWWSQIHGWIDGGELFPYIKGDNGLIKPQQVIETLYQVTHGDAYVTSDVGQHQMFAAQYYKFNRPHRWINSGGLGTMGFGLPAAMGIKLNFPEETVVCVTGEGSVQMNIQELSTCLQYDLPVKIINVNNQALGMVRQWQDMQYDGRYSHSYMESLPDFKKLVESYGHVGIRVDKPEELLPQMQAAFEMKDRLVFMDIHVDPSEHVYPMQIKDGSMCDMWVSKTERT
jgi:acetolactate synthase-1/2/3 large subunit